MAAILFDSCKKDKDEVELSTDFPTNQIQALGGGVSENDGVWVSPSTEQLNFIWNDMMTDVNYTNALDFIFMNGVPHWNEACLIEQLDGTNYLLSIPTIIEDKVVGVIFASVLDNEISYFHVHLALLQQDINEIFGTLGQQNALLAITMFARHQQHLGNYMSLCLYEHLQSEEVRSAMDAVVPRDWCLIKVELRSPKDPTNPDGNNGNGDGSDDDTPDQAYIPPNELINITSAGISLLVDYIFNLMGGGLQGGHHYEDDVEVFYFWAWCEDGFDSPSIWDYWSASGNGIGGAGIPDVELPDWTYYGDEWFEGNEECMFYFGGFATQEFTNFEEELLSSSCGDAAAYVVQNTMANVINGICEQNAGEFPSEMISVDETMNEISNSLETNMFYEAGVFICQHCEGEVPSCIDPFNACGTVDFEECVAEHIFSYSWKLLIDDPASAPEEEDVDLIDEDFYYLDLTFPDTPPTGDFMGGVPPRGNTEDIEFGTDGDVEGILPEMVPLTDNELFDEMTDLFHLTSKGVLETVSDEFIDAFENNTVEVVDYHNQTLSEEIGVTTVMANFYTRVRNLFEEQLAANNGDISGINLEIPLNQRPIFNGMWHKVNGHTILVHDTEETRIHLSPDDFTYDESTGHWEGTFQIEIIDHFGLDRGDVLEFQNTNDGFAAWWLLQHTRGYAPLRTKIWINVTLEGDI